MTTLVEHIRAQIETKHGSNKSLASAIHTRLQEAGDGVQFKTVEQKLSKLLTGDLDGDAFFFKAPPRTDALAVELDLKPSQLNRLRDQPVLVLDSKLPDAQREYLLRRGQELGSYAIACLSGAGREELRDEARRHRHAIVVLSDDTDRLFFDGAGVDVSQLTAHPRGFTLTTAPETVPLPAAPPPPLWSGQTPLIPDAALTEVLVAAELPLETSLLPNPDIHAEHDRYAFKRRFIERNPDLRRLVEDHPAVLRDIATAAARATTRGEIPSYEIDAVWLFRRLRFGAPPARFFIDYHSDSTRAKTAMRAALGWSDETVVWTHGKRIYAVGPDVAAIAAALKPHHDVEQPATLTALTDEWRTCNPWPDASNSPWRQQRETILRETGLDLGVVHAEMKQHLEPKRDPCSSSGRFPDDRALVAIRSRLAAPLNRHLLLPKRSRPYYFLLNRLRSAPLVQLDTGDKNLLHVIADLGRQTTVDVWVRTFTDEPGAAEFIDDGSTIDGGDFRMWISADTHHPDWLRGPSS